MQLGVYLSLLCVLLSGCTDILHIQGQKDLLKEVKSKGYSLIIKSNKNDVQSKVVTAAKLYFDGEPVAIEGGNVISIQTNMQSAYLNQFGKEKYAYVGVAQISSDSNKALFTTEFSPKEVRSKRFYPTDLYVQTEPREYVGGHFNVTYPEALTIFSPMAQHQVNSAYTKINLSWSKPAVGNQVEISSYEHCTGHYKVIHRYTVTNEAQEHVALNLDEIFRKGATANHFVESLMVFIVSLVTGQKAISNQPKSIKECKLDLYFKNIKYKIEELTSSAGFKKGLRRISSVSSSQSSSVVFKSEQAYEF